MVLTRQNNKRASSSKFVDDNYKVQLVEHPIFYKFQVPRYFAYGLSTNPTKKTPYLKLRDFPEISYGVSFQVVDKVKAQMSFFVSGDHVDVVDNIDVKVAFSIDGKPFSQEVAATGRKDIKAVCYIENVKQFFDENQMDNRVDVTIDSTLTFKYKVARSSINFEFRTLGTGLWERDDKDCTFVANGVEIKAHKLVLALASSVFDRMFQSQFKEAETNRIVITDFSSEVVQLAVRSCYELQLGDIDLEIQLSLLQFFDKYDMQKYKAVLENILSGLVTSFTVCRIAKSAEISNSPSLKGKCLKFLGNCACKTSVAGLNNLDYDTALTALTLILSQKDDEPEIIEDSD